MPSLEPLSINTHSTEISPIAARAERNVISASSGRLCVTTITLRSGRSEVSLGLIIKSNGPARRFSRRAIC